jgi:hypothetical protein
VIGYQVTTPPGGPAIACKVGVVHFRPMTSPTHASSSVETQEKRDGNPTKNYLLPDIFL